MTNTSWCFRGCASPARPSFNGFDLELNLVRCRAIVRRLIKLFPGVCEPGEAQYWTGLRPATPSNVPYIGAFGISKPLLEHGAPDAWMDALLRFRPCSCRYCQRSTA